MNRTLTVLLPAMLFLSAPALAQEPDAVKKIDKIAARIDNEKLNVKTDSIKQDMKASQMSIVVYMQRAVSEGKLRRYAINTVTVTTERGLTRTINSFTTMYFDKGVLIKVRDETISEDYSEASDFYYADGKFLFSRPESELAEARAGSFLIMAATVLNGGR